MARILVVGNINADRVIALAGPLRRGRDIRGEDRGIRLGGAGANTASALVLAGHEVRLAGFLGSDPLGDRLARELARWRWDVAAVGRLPGATPACQILIEPDGERTILSLGAPAAPAVWPRFDLADVDALFVGSRWPVPAALLFEAKRRGIPVAAQLRPAHGPAPEAVDVLLASADELEGEPWASVTAGGHRCRWLVVTRGAAGALACDGERQLAMPAVPTAVVDTTGAGDAFAAAIVHGLARAWPIERSLALALDWGALAVAHPASTAPPGIADSVAGGRPPC